MAKFKTVVDNTILQAFKSMLEKSLVEWNYHPNDRIYKAALVECLSIIRMKLAVPEYRSEYKITFTETQALSLHWLLHNTQFVITEDEQKDVTIIYLMSMLQNIKTAINRQYS